ncbi:SET and MYND domain containing, class 4, member 3 isoform X2 [Rhodnius prolixus]|uniref:SET and MYND domain containing, class 4, member 3 isoform X2 n=1 Tax=Rhodnius prolixus TaxID=13249 RepID=UPI003D18DAEB
MCEYTFKETLDKNDLNKFKSLNNCYDWVKWTKYASLGGQFPNDKTLGKDRSESIYFKENGNQEFLKGNKNEALELYNASLLLYPIDGDEKEHSIIRANRSAVLYELNEYDLALNDIEKALNIGYPTELQYKILDRKAKCLLALKQHQKAIEAFRETITALDNAKLSLERRQKWQKDVQIMLAVMTKNNAKDEKMSSKKIISKIRGKHNTTYTSAISSVDVKYNEQAGRYAVASADIPCGEILLCEKAYCAVLLNENAKTHCFQCFKRVIAGEPCPTCSYVRFCSDKCKTVALNSHHKYECAVLETLWSSGISVTCLMSLRIISQSNVDFFLNIRKELKETDGKWNEKEYNSTNFMTIYQLVRHEKRRSLIDLLQRSYMALFLLSCLQQTGYFSSIVDEHAKEDAELLIGGLIMRFLQILQFNAHEISELEIKGNNLKDWKSIFLGGGLYPTLALFNHSCEPAIVRYFHGTNIVARAVKRIKAGDMIAENYGPIFTIKPRKERQIQLSQQYWFECACVACINNWPMLDYMDPEILRFLCDNVNCNNVLIVGSDNMDIQINCRVCGKQTNIMKGLKALQDSESLFRLGESLMQTGEIEKALAKFLELYELLADNLVPPFRDYYLCQQRIRSCFLALGNTSSPIERLLKRKTY